MRQIKKSDLTREYRVEEAGELLDFLLTRVRDKSRNAVKHLLSGRQVQVNGKTVTRFDCPLIPGQSVRILPPEEARGARAPFPILYEDDDLIAVNKPAGLLTVANERERERTAYRALSDYLGGDGREKKLFVVHRLDQDTSGVVLFAKNDTMKYALQDDWDNLVERRIYIAVTDGVPPQEEGTVRSWLKETAAHVVYSAGSGSGGKEAVTHYRVLNKGGGYALLEVALDTGRKNQIRVHMKDLGCPVAGDKKYGSGRGPLGRLGLHAAELTLTDPRTGEKRTFSAPVPKVFRGFFKDQNKTNIAE